MKRIFSAIHRPDPSKNSDRSPRDAPRSEVVSRNAPSGDLLVSRGNTRRPSDSRLKVDIGGPLPLPPEQVTVRRDSLSDVDQTFAQEAKSAGAEAKLEDWAQQLIKKMTGELFHGNMSIRVFDGAKRLLAQLVDADTPEVRLYTLVRLCAELARLAARDDAAHVRDAVNIMRERLRPALGTPPAGIAHSIDTGIESESEAFQLALLMLPSCAQVASDGVSDEDSRAVVSEPTVESPILSPVFCSELLIGGAAAAAGAGELVRALQACHAPSEAWRPLALLALVNEPTPQDVALTLLAAFSALYNAGRREAENFACLWQPAQKRREAPLVADTLTTLANQLSGSVSFQKDPTMAVHLLQPLLRLLPRCQMRDDQNDALRFLATFKEAERFSLAWVLHAYGEEIAQTGVRAELLRENDSASLLARAWVAELAEKHLHPIKKVVKPIAQQDVWPYRAGTEPAEQIESIGAAMRASAGILDKASNLEMPPALRCVLHHVYDAVVAQARSQDMNSAEADAAAMRIVGGIYVLRLLAPAVVMPQNWGLASPREYGKWQGRQNLILVSKLLQAASNGATGELKDFEGEVLIRWTEAVETLNVQMQDLLRQAGGLPDAPL